MSSIVHVTAATPSPDSWAQVLIAYLFHATCPSWWNIVLGRQVRRCMLMPTPTFGNWTFSVPPPLDIPVEPPFPPAARRSTADPASRRAATRPSRRVVRSTTRAPNCGGMPGRNVGTACAASAHTGSNSSEANAASLEAAPRVSRQDTSQRRDPDCRGFALPTTFVIRGVPALISIPDNDAFRWRAIMRTLPEATHAR